MKFTGRCSPLFEIEEALRNDMRRRADQTPAPSPVKSPVLKVYQQRHKKGFEACVKELGNNPKLTSSPKLTFCTLEQVKKSMVALDLIIRPIPQRRHVILEHNVLRAVSPRIEELKVEHRKRAREEERKSITGKRAKASSVASPLSITQSV